MIVDVIMPKLGESITEGTIIQWRKKAGETVEMDEILLEIGTDKVDSEIPSPAAGVVKEILAQPNDVLPVNEVIARIETDAEVTTEAAPSVKEEKVEETPQAEPSSEPVSEAVSAPPVPAIEVASSRDVKRTFYTPLVRAIARREGVSEDELSSISGTGRAGRVTKGDIMVYIEKREAAPLPPPVAVSQEPAILQTQAPSAAMDDHVEEMDRIRQTISEHMRHSIDTAAHVYLVSECDVTNMVHYVKEQQAAFLQHEGFKLTYTPFFILGAVKAIQTHPKFNAWLDGTSIIFKKNINIGMAVAMDKGLMVPVIPNCEELNFLGLCRKVNDLAVRGRSGKISPDELQGSTFTVSNFGVFGNSFGMPIINQPNSAILGVGAIKKQPVVRETPHGDAVVIRSICNLSIGIDHRLLDGSDGGGYLKTLVTFLEEIDTSALL